MNVDYFDDERNKAERCANKNKIGGSINDIKYVSKLSNPTNEMTNDSANEMVNIKTDTSKCSCGFVYAPGNTDSDSTCSIKGGKNLSVSKVCPMCTKTASIKGGEGCPGVGLKEEDYTIKSSNGIGRMIISAPELTYDGYEVDEVDRQKTFELGKNLIDQIGQGGLPNSIIKKQANLLMGSVNTANKEITGAVYSNHNQYVNKRKQKKKSFNIGSSQEFGLRNIGGGHIMSTMK